MHVINVLCVDLVSFLSVGCTGVESTVSEGQSPRLRPAQFIAPPPPTSPPPPETPTPGSYGDHSFTYQSSVQVADSSIQVHVSNRDSALSGKHALSRTNEESEA